MTRPRCQCCDKPLAYRTGVMWWSTQPDDECPRTKADVEKLTSMQVTSVHYWGHPDTGARHIIRANVWDRKTYEGYPYAGGAPLFCTLACALAFAAAAHQAGFRRGQP